MRLVRKNSGWVMFFMTVSLLVLVFVCFYSTYRLKAKIAEPPAVVGTEENLPVEKLETETQSPLNGAQKLQDTKNSVDGLLDELASESVYLNTTGYLTLDQQETFLCELCCDVESKKVFVEYGKRNISIFLGNEYSVNAGCVFVNTHDGVKKVTKWLKTGKVE